ncbi:nitroreductase [Actinosynnema pretiosum subsp. pretiosum]|uniref:Nitroreductase n=2 Tax=Actinosynnema TaxID=40566 RepID=C6WKA6_ACTMD|nr:nitroreductase [Actinosynnema mirum]ACU38319.1 nitroreductase [Actinosynnema mirum DSM 43827]AXX31840.1 NfnB protein [Actinosynnema pretiosum subsp. pretiosum]QUF04171.1 nitroreductase [Actinosynnema pretiosum subsp. pretiosum]
MPTTLPALADRLIRGRRATRAFLPDPLPRETLEAVFTLAGAAPSNSNAQPWQVEVVSGAAKDRLASALVAAHAAGHRSVDFPYSHDVYSPTHLRRRAEAGAALYGALGIGREAEARRAEYDERSLRFYEAPHVALLFAPDSGDPRLTADVGMYAQTLLLAMEAHGVASCPQALLSFYADVVRETLGVTGGKLLFGVAFGHADPTAPVNAITVGRAPLDETTRFHR